MKSKKRCAWATSKTGEDPLMILYHDKEWGVPVKDDQKLFEFLVLESAQAGLSWRTILHRREGYRKAFANFDPRKVARFTPSKVEKLLKDVGIIRNRAKIEAAVNNAKRFLEIQKQFGSFYKYSMQFIGGKRLSHQIRKSSDYPETIPEAENFAKDLKARGFKFLGPTTVYAHMQASGMVNDHMMHCFRRSEVK